MRLRLRKRGQSWEDEAFDERERNGKMGQCESLREREKKVERRPCCKVRIQSLVHIGKCLHNIFLSYHAEIISLVCASLASEQKSCHGPTGPLAHSL